MNTQQRNDLYDKLVLWGGQLEGIHEELKKLNGRITDNAKCVRSLTAWRDRLAGGLVVVVLLVIPIIVYIVKSWIPAG